MGNENFFDKVINFLKNNKENQNDFFLCNFFKTPKIGLNNIGPTCLNAVLQCFSQTTILTEYFLNKKNEELIFKGKFKNDSNKQRLSISYYNVLRNLWPSDGFSHVKYFEPKEFKQVLENLIELQPELIDAKIIIIFFLEQIHQEINLKLSEMDNQN